MKVPKYKWESVGPQDDCIRKICYLGPYYLEHVEYGWIKKLDGSTYCEMSSHVYKWNEEILFPELIAQLPRCEYVPGESQKPLEDWYAMNVLVEQLFTGSADEDV